MSHSNDTAELREALDAYLSAHKTAERAIQHHADLDADLKAVKTRLLEEITGELDGSKPKFSNDAKREAELQRRLAEQHADLIQAHEAATIRKRETQAAVERAEASLKTWRALVAHETARITLQAAQVEVENAGPTITHIDDFHPPFVDAWDIPEPPRGQP